MDTDLLHEIEVGEPCCDFCLSERIPLVRELGRKLPSSVFVKKRVSM